MKKSKKVKKSKLPKKLGAVEVRKAITKYKAKHKLSNKDLAKKLKVSASTAAAWQKPAGSKSKGRHVPISKRSKILGKLKK